MATKRKAAKSRKTTTKRRKTHLSASPVKSRTKRRMTRKKNEFLSEMFNPATATATGMAMLSGAAGAGVNLLSYKLFLAPDANLTKKAITSLIESFVFGAVLKKPNVCSGIASSFTTVAMMEKGLLADNSPFKSHKYAKNIKALPMVLNENGDPLQLSQQDDMFLSENIMDLAENFSYQSGQQGQSFGG